MDIPSGDVKYNVGPGMAEHLKTMAAFQGNVPPSEASEMMKEFLSKSVEQLAAEDPESKIETINVRGDAIVLPPKGIQRQNTIMFACLYALRDPEVDRIMRALKLHSQLVFDGKVVNRQLVPDAPPGPSIQEAEEKPARNIILEVGGFVHGKDNLVAVQAGDDKASMWLGTISQDPDDTFTKDGVAHYEVRPLFGGNPITIEEGRLIPIRTEAQLREILNSIASAK